MIGSESGIIPEVASSETRVGSLGVREVTDFARAATNDSKSGQDDGADPCQSRTIGLGAWRGSSMSICESVRGLLSKIHCSCIRTSCAVWIRWSGFLAKHAWTTRSSDSGVIGWSSRISGGSAVMMAAIKLAWLSPSNALLPQSIS